MALFFISDLQDQAIDLVSRLKIMKVNTESLSLDFIVIASV